MREELRRASRRAESVEGEFYRAIAVQSRNDRCTGDFGCEFLVSIVILMQGMSCTMIISYLFKCGSVAAPRAL